MLMFYVVGVLFVHCLVQPQKPGCVSYSKKHLFRLKNIHHQGGWPVRLGGNLWHVSDAHPRLQECAFSTSVERNIFMGIFREPNPKPRFSQEMAGAGLKGWSTTIIPGVALGGTLKFRRQFGSVEGGVVGYPAQLSNWLIFAMECI